MGQQILDMGGFHELEPAILDKWDLPAHEFKFQLKGVMGCPEKHGHIIEWEPLVQISFYRLRYKHGLFGVCPRIDNHWLFTALPLSKEAFGISFRGLIHDSICKCKYGLGWSIILFKFYYLDLREKPGEIKHVSIIGPPEGIYGLRVIANNHDISVIRSKPLYDFGLDAIGVLVFINHDIAVSHA